MVQVREYDYTTGNVRDVGPPYKKADMAKAQGEVAMLNAGDSDAGYFFLASTTHRSLHDFPLEKMLASH